MGKEKTGHTITLAAQGNFSHEISCHLMTFYAKQILDFNTDSIVRYELLNIVKSFIAQSGLCELWKIPYELQKYESVEPLIKAICLADMIAFQEVDLSAISVDIRNTLPNLAQDSISCLDLESLQECFIMRLKYHIDNNKVDNNFYERWIKIENSIPSCVLSKIKQNIPELTHRNFQPIDFDREKLARLEVELFCLIYKISPSPLYDIVEQQEMGIWKNSALKTKTIEFYKDLYDDFPEMIDILCKLESEERINCTNEKIESVKNIIFANIGKYFSVFSEENVIIYMILNPRIIELIEEFIIHPIATQEITRSIYCKFKKLDANLVNAIQETYKDLIRGQNKVNNTLLKVNMKIKCNEKQIQELRELLSAKDASGCTNNLELLGYDNMGYEYSSDSS